MNYVLDRDESLQKRYNLTTVFRFFLGIMFESFITVIIFQQETRKDFNIHQDFLVMRKDFLSFGAEKLFSVTPSICRRGQKARNHT